MTEPVMTARMWRVEELVVSPTTVDDLRQYQYERERRDEVGDLVVEQNGFEELPEKPAAFKAMQNRIRSTMYFRGIIRHTVTDPGSPYWNTPSGTSWQWRQRAS